MTRETHLQLSFPLSRGLSLHFREKTGAEALYPSGIIQKGAVLWHDADDLSEEGVGFGVPVLKRGHETIYPGSARFEVRMEGTSTVVRASYNLNIQQKAYKKQRPVLSPAFYRMNEGLSKLHRRHAFLRTFLDRSGTFVRRAFHVEIKFEERPSSGYAVIEYRIDAGKKEILIALDIGRIPSGGRDEVFMMNEQGANSFDIYRDSDGAYLKKESIGTWEEVRAQEATFADSSRGFSFTLSRVDEAKMFRGRELVPGKLAWAGLAYQLPQHATSFSYLVKIGDGMPQ